MSCRGVTESNIRIQGLLEEKTMLVAALKELSGDTDFNPTRHPDVLKLMEKVGHDLTHTVVSI